MTAFGPLPKPYISATAWASSATFQTLVTAFGPLPKPYISATAWASSATFQTLVTAFGPLPKPYISATAWASSDPFRPTLVTACVPPPLPPPPHVQCRVSLRQLYSDFRLTPRLVQCCVQIVGMIRDLEKLQDDYEALTTSLLEWIRHKITTLNDRNFPNSLEGIQKELLHFKEYMTVEKPPKSVQCSFYPPPPPHTHTHTLSQFVLGIFERCNTFLCHFVVTLLTVALVKILTCDACP